MPQVFKIGGYWVYFWANEGEPIEPVHVHIAYGKPHLPIIIYFYCYGIGLPLP